MGGLFEDFLIVGLAKPATGGPLELKMLYHLQKEKSEEAKAIVEVRARASCPFTKKPALKKVWFASARSSAFQISRTSAMRPATTA